MPDPYYLDVKQCGHCGEAHHGLKFEPLPRPLKVVGPLHSFVATHVALCPKEQRILFGMEAFNYGTERSIPPQEPK